MNAMTNLLRICVSCMMCVFSCLILNGAGTPIIFSISLEEALAKTQSDFEGQDVDYYLVEQDVLPEMNVLFVDAQPEASWEHECYLYFFHKETRWYPYTPAKELCSLPPEETLIPLKVSNRQKFQKCDFPNLNREVPSRAPNAVAGKTWAVVISGGINKNSNHQRYWEYCSFLYKTLRTIYEIPKDHISVLMSDGTNPAADMAVSTYNPFTGKTDVSYVSQPLDLDDDGVDDIQYSATKANIGLVIRELVQKTQKGDHVFFFVADHGGSEDKELGSSYICLWGDKHHLKDNELAEWVDPLLENGVTLSFVLGQCYSGGFVDDLSKTGCVVSTSVSKDDVCYGNQQSSFLYHWTCAVSRQWADGTDVKYRTARQITSDLAFSYAYKQVYGDETGSNAPQYKSTHQYIGEELALDKLPDDIDLFIKDFEEDTGKEIYDSTKIYYDSPSIWVRNEDDNKLEHENPQFSLDHDKCWVYVRIHNRGRFDYQGGQFLHIYWAKSSLNVTSKTWLGQEEFEGELTGGLISSVPIRSIKAGESRIVKMCWDMPQIPSQGDDRLHFCLLAKIMNNEFDDGSNSSNDYINPQLSRRQAQKNVIIIPKIELANVFSVFVRAEEDDSDNSDDCSIELIPRTSYDRSIYSRAIVEMELSPKVFNAWVRGGKKARSITTQAASPRKVLFTAMDSRLESLQFNKNEVDRVGMKFSFKLINPTLPKASYTLDLIQRNRSGKILGGVTFQIQPPTVGAVTPDLVATPIKGNEVLASVISENLAEVVWLNEHDEVLGNESSLTVYPTSSSNVLNMAALNRDGELAVKEFSLASIVGIESISPESAVGDELTVTMRNPTAVGDKLIIAGVSESGDRIDFETEADSKSISIDTSSLRPGLYVISYISSNDVVDTKKFTKK